MSTLPIYSPWGGKNEVAIEVARYAGRGNHLAIQLWCVETPDVGFCPTLHANENEWWWEPYARLTVNFPGEKLADNEAFVDTNNVPNAEEFIEENGLGVCIPGVKMSGFCVYPKYRFDMEKLAQFSV